MTSFNTATIRFQFTIKKTKNIEYIGCKLTTTMYSFLQDAHAFLYHFSITDKKAYETIKYEGKKKLTCGKVLDCCCGIINAGAICICEDGKTNGAWRVTKGCVFRAYDRTELVDSVVGVGADDVKLKKFLE